MESLAKSLSPNEKLTKLVTNTQQHKNEPFQFYFTNHQSNLDNTELNILCNALSIEDNTKCLYLSHQKNFLNLEALGKFVENSRCLRQLDISFSDVGDFTPVFSAINTDGANIGYWSGC